VFVVSVMCCQVGISATGRLLVQRSPTGCGVSECNREASTMRRPWPIRGCHVMNKEMIGYHEETWSDTLDNVILRVCVCVCVCICIYIHIHTHTYAYMLIPVDARSKP